MPKISIEWNEKKFDTLLAISKFLSRECFTPVFGREKNPKNNCRYHYSKGMQKYYLGKDCLEMVISFISFFQDFMTAF